MSDIEPSNPANDALVPAVPAARVPARPPSPAFKTAVARSVPLNTLLKRTGPMILYQMNRIGGIGAAGAAVLLFAVIFFFSAVLPQQKQLITLEDQIRQAHHVNSSADSAPVRLNRFMNSLPKRSELPKILGQVFSLAGTSSVTLDKGRYEMSPTRSGHLAQYRMTFPIKGRYPDIRKFIDSVLTTVPSAALEGLHIERKAVGDDSVAADLRFSVFVRNDL